MCPFYDGPNLISENNLDLVMYVTSNNFFYISLIFYFTASKLLGLARSLKCKLSFAGIIIIFCIYLYDSKQCYEDSLWVFGSDCIYNFTGFAQS